MVPLIIAVDFDGTVVTHDYPRVGKTVPGAIPVLKRLTRAGHLLILFTMRSGMELHYAIEWFKANEIPLYGIQFNPQQASWTSSNKCYANVYIDDAALGCPLERNQEFSARPYVNWFGVDVMLEAQHPGIYHSGGPVIYATKDMLDKLDAGNWLRADGSVECPDCKKPYKTHPYLVEKPWVNVLCNGDLVKL